MKWFRTCQECDAKQYCQEPSPKMTDSYANAKCRKCKSMALDYGKYELPEEDWAE